MQGKIIKNISNDYTVLGEDREYICKGRGKFRNENIIPLVGDDVLFDEHNNYILKILQRKNELIRPPISNIDQAFIITSVKNPNLDLNLLDKLLVNIEFNNIKPIICFTKLDLLDSSELKAVNEIINYYQKIGYLVFRNTDIDNIKDVFKNKYTVFTGQSGAGKSTLLNKLDSNIMLKTDDISVALGRGKHTTRHIEFLKLYGGYVADTPGFSSLDFNGMTNNDIKDQFIEFSKFKEHCKYRDCMHDLEDDCEIKRQLSKEVLKSRYDNYLYFIHNNKKSRW